MHFNDEELALGALSPPHKFSKEGVLFTKPLKKSLKKSKSTKDGFVERWFCLKGNLLFCMKGIDRTHGVAGVIILERCSVELDADESDNLFSFVIGQAESDELIYLGCRTEQDRDEWISSLHTASYECMKMQLENLREQITLKTGRDPIISPHSIPVINTRLVSESEAPFIEICLSCSQLVCTDNRSPNSMIDILSLIPPTTDWHMIGQTETVENSHNPFFMKTIGIGDSQAMQSKMRIKLIIYDVKELVSRTRTQIGQASFVLEDSLPSKRLTLGIISPDRTQVGSVSIMSWSTTSMPSDNVNFVPAIAMGEALPGESMTTIAHGDRTYRTKKKDQLKFLFCNTVCRVFRFPTVNNHELSVCEMMAESRLTFVLPIIFLKFLLKGTNEKIDKLHCLDKSPDTHLDRQQRAVVLNLMPFSAYLSETIHYLESKHSRQTFRASQLKGEKKLEPVPLNLHIYRMLVCNEYTLSGASHDIITVGAFAAHSKGFKHGGLSRLLKSFSSDSQSQHFQLPNMARLSQLMDATQELDNLRHLIASTCEDIYRACMTKDREPLVTARDLLTDMSRKLTEFCIKNPLVTESMINFYSSSAIIHPESDSQSKNGSSRHTHAGVNGSSRHAFVGASTQKTSQSHHRSPQFEESPRRSPPRAAPSQEMWFGAVSSVEGSMSALLASVEKCLDGADPAAWLETVSSDKMMCEAFVEKLYHLTYSGLTYATVQQTISSDPFTANPELNIRYTNVCSQALTTAVTGVLSKVRFSITDEEFLTQLSNIGCLLHFESLLSCHGSETGMLEDFIVGVQYLAGVEFKFSESLSSKDDYMEHPPVITGNRLKVCVTMPMPSLAFSLLPESLQKGQTFKIIPVMFNIGFNEMATIAESVGSTVLQEKLNKASLEIISDYYMEYQKHFGSVGSTLNSRYSVAELLVKLGQNVNDSKKKNMDILQLSSEICRKLNGIRFTSCKSAKDRTAMSVTLEACKILQQVHELSPHLFERALSCLRSEGVRRQNTYKNTGVLSYAFSSFQLLSFPKAYKPPTGTYGKGET